MSLKRFGLSDLKNLTKFSLASGNAIIPMFQYSLMAQPDLLFSTHTAYVFAGSLFMAMATQTFNQVIEWRKDKLMTRTCNRPIPVKKITQSQASALGLGFYMASNLICLQLPWEALLINNLIFYSYLGIYTPLKPRSSINTFLGAIVGALPVFLGAACVPGADIVNLGSVSNFMFMLTWQIQHFFGIYWKYQQDYLRAGFKMLNDHKKAGQWMQFSMVVNLCSQLGTAMSLCTGLGSLLGLIALLGTYQWQYRPILQFMDNPKENASNLKMSSYYFFLVYYSILVCEIGYRKWKEHKKQQQQQ